MRTSRARSNTTVFKSPVNEPRAGEPIRYVDQMFYDPDFNPEQIADKKCKGAKTDQIQATINDLDLDLRQVNSFIVVMLEEDSNLFVDLSKTISTYEREFTDFPSVIQELKRKVNEASNFPVPSFDTVPDIPTVKNFEIIGKPSWYVNAPLMYESLVQQHRVPESIKLVVDCLAVKPEEKLETIENWVDKVRQLIYKDILTRLKAMNVNSDEAQFEFKQLLKLGFEEECVSFFFKIAQRSLDEQLGSQQNTGQLLQYVRTTSKILCETVAKDIETFRNLFPQKYDPELVVWATKQIETKLPISHPNIFAGNFNLVKESVKTMIDATQPFNKLGISTLYVFESMPARLADLLNASAQQHTLDIQEAITEDEWEIAIDEISAMQVSEYPLTTSFEHYRSHLMQFYQELHYLYVPEIFYDCVKMLKKVILSYSESCLDFLHKNESISVVIFCVILVQLVCLTQRILPEAMEEFKSLTGFPFPDEQLTVNEVNKTVDEIVQILVNIFGSIWIRTIQPDKLEWNGMESLNPLFAAGIQVTTQFVGFLTLPPQIFQQLSDVLVDLIVKMVEITGNMINDADMLNSFDFHWEYFSRSVSGYFSRSVNEKMKAGIQAASTNISHDKSIDGSQRASFKDIIAAVTKCKKLAEEAAAAAAAAEEDEYSDSGSGGYSDSGSD